MKHHITNVQFVINEKKRTVTCITDGYINSTYPNLVWTFYTKNASILDKKFWSMQGSISGFESFRAVKTARCADEDFKEGEWTRTGKKIAYAKCMEKIYGEIIKLHWVIDRAFSEELDASWVKYVNKADGIEAKIAKLTNIDNTNN